MGILQLFALVAWPATALASPYLAYSPEQPAKDIPSQAKPESNSPTATASPSLEASSSFSSHGSRTSRQFVPNRNATDAAPELKARGCTTTIRNNNIPCYWDGTQTLYTATRTLTAPVDCHGCSDIYVQQDVYFCPVEKIYTTIWAPNPSTTWITVCATSTQKAVNLHKKDILTNDAALPGRTRAPNPAPTGI